MFKAQVLQFPGGAAAVAKRLGCSRTFVYELISGKKDKRAGVDLASKIQTLLGIPMQMWARPTAVRR